MSHQDRAFFSTFVGVLGFLIVVALIFFFIAQNVSSLSGGDKGGADSMAEQAANERIKPIGQVNTGAAAASDGAAAAPAAARSGKDIVANVCASCHTAGVAGAPKLGDKAAWAPRAEKGLDGLMQSATNGLNAMPPKGTCVDCSDEELKGAIVALLAEAGIELAGAPAAAAAAAPAPTEAAPAATAAVDGKKIYDTSCMACHAAGVAGAPKLGDKAAWAPRIAQGMDTLHQHAVNGIRAMPPKGTCMTCSDADLAAAVDYMVSQSK